MEDVKNTTPGTPVADDKEALMKAALEIVDAALAEVDRLEKSDVNEDADGQGMEVVDPMAPNDAEKSEDAPEEEHDHSEEEPAPESDEKKDDEEKEEESEEAPEAPVEKTEPKVSEVEELRKTYDERFEGLMKAISDLTSKVEALSKSSKGRRGATNVAPLEKNEKDAAGAEPAPQRGFTRRQVVESLVKAQAEGKHGVTSLLVAKVETGSQLSKSEFELVKSLVQ